MKLTSQRRIAADVLKCGVNRVWFDEKRGVEIKEAITKSDIRSLIKDLAIHKRDVNTNSGYRRRKKSLQKRKGRSAGQGKRKGTKNARLNTKTQWINKVRAQRKFIKNLKDKKVIPTEIHRKLYRKSKGGFFRSVGHIKLFMEEHNILKHENKKNKGPAIQKKKAR